jgi:hypothetical protein
MFIVLCFFAFVAFHVAMTRPALSKQDQQRVRELIATSGAERGSEALFKHMLEIQRRQQQEEPPPSTANPTGATVIPVGVGNGNGSSNVNVSSYEVGIKSFTRFLVELRVSLSKAQIRQLYAKIDKNGNGAISLQEFQDFLGDVKNATTKANTEAKHRESKKKQGTKRAENIPSNEGMPNVVPKKSAGVKPVSFTFPTFDLGTAVRFPSIRLDSLYPTNTALPLHVELPGFSLQQFPGLDLEAISTALKSGALDVPSITLPPIKLKNFPGMLQASMPDELGEVELPSIQLRDFPGLALPTAGLASFRLPGCKLGKIPGINLPPSPEGPSGLDAPNAPRFDLGSLDIPSFCLGDVPGINLSEIQMQLQTGKLQLADLQLPVLKLEEFLLPRMSLANPTAPEFEIPALRASLGAVVLPSFSLGAAFPNLDFSVATSFFSLEAPKIPVIGGSVSMDSIELPEIQLGAFPDLDLGGTYPDLDGMLLGSLDFSAMDITLPPITLADLPNFDVSKITAQLRAGAVDMPSLRLPPLQLQDFPGIKLPDVGAQLTLPSGMVLDLGKITLPSVSLDQFMGLALPGAGLSSFKLPKCRLQDFPEIKLPPLPQGLELPDDFDVGTIEIPSFRLGLIPNIDLPKLSLQLQAGELRLPELRLPELRLDGDFLLPEIELLLKIRFKFNLRLKGARLPDFGKLWDGLSQWLKQVELPSFELGQFPQLQVPDWDWGQMPDLDFLPDADVSMKLPDLPNVTIRMPSINLPDMPDFDSSLSTVPTLHLENPLGGLMMKFKLLLGFGQVLSYFAITFSSIPWGPRFTALFKFFELFSFDIFGFFGATSCQLQTGFLEKFGFHVRW